MALITRISRLFSADFHAVLDRIEEPELLLKQAIREMEEELARSEQRCKWLQQEQGQLSAREDDIEQSLARLSEELDICFTSGKEDLARKLVRRQLEARALLKSVRARHHGCSANLADLGTAVAENREQLEVMRQKAEILLAREQVAEPGNAWQGDFTAAEHTVRDEEVEVAFLKEKQGRNLS